MKLPDEVCAECSKTISLRAKANVVDGRVLCTACAGKATRQLEREKRELAPGCFYTKIVGVTQGNRQQLLRRLAIGQLLILRHDPMNRFSEHAIEVRTETGKCLGFIADDLSGELLEKQRRGLVTWAVVKDLTGGTRDYPTHGCNIEVFYDPAGPTFQNPPAASGILARLIGRILRFVR